MEARVFARLLVGNKLTVSDWGRFKSEINCFLGLKDLTPKPIF